MPAAVADAPSGAGKPAGQPPPSAAAATAAAAAAGVAPPGLLPIPWVPASSKRVGKAPFLNLLQRYIGQHPLGAGAVYGNAASQQGAKQAGSTSSALPTCATARLGGAVRREGGRVRLPRVRPPNALQQGHPGRGASAAAAGMNTGREADERGAVSAPSNSALPAELAAIAAPPAPPATTCSACSAGSGFFSKASARRGAAPQQPQLLPCPRTCHARRLARRGPGARRPAVGREVCSGCASLVRQS